MCQSSFIGFGSIQGSSKNKSDKNRMLANHASISAKLFIATPEVVADPNWYLDSEATDHIVFDFRKVDVNSTYTRKQ